MPTVTMTMEEYHELIRGVMASEIPVSTPRVISKKKRVGKKDPKMARALKKANEMGRKKSGGFKKGWSQGKIISKDHQLRRKMR